MGAHLLTLSSNRISLPFLIIYQAADFRKLIEKILLGQSFLFTSSYYFWFSSKDLFLCRLNCTKIRAHLVYIWCFQIMFASHIEGPQHFHRLCGEGLYFNSLKASLKFRCQKKILHCWRNYSSMIYPLKTASFYSSARSLPAPNIIHCYRGTHWNW